MNISNQTKVDNSVTTTGTMIAMFTPPLVRTVIPKVCHKCVGNMVTTNRTLSQPEIDTLELAADKALKISGLEAQGIRLNKVNKHSPLPADEAKIIEEIDKMNVSEAVKEQLKIGRSNTYSAIQGVNANFTPSTRTITYNKKKFALSAFHEMGHAQNYTQSKIGKALQKTSMFLMSYGRNNKIAAAIAVASAIAPSKIEQNLKPDTKESRIAGKLRDYAPLLVTLPFMPTVIEEGMASIKGQKLAKNLLSPDLAKKVGKVNTLGFITYAIRPLAWAVGTYLGLKAKDNLAKYNVNEKLKSNHLNYEP
jgi:hypothetical protein